MREARLNGYIDKINNNSKLCSCCKNILPLSKFNKSGTRKNGYQLWCKDCGLVAKKNSYHTYRKDRVQLLARSTQLKTQYGLSLIDYDNLLKKQNGVCAICSKKEKQKSNKNGKIDSLRVDHCHKTGIIRGLLCSKCNFGIGQFQDNINLLNKAINYLQPYDPNRIKKTRMRGVEQSNT